MSAQEIAELIGRSPAWVRRNVPKKIMLGYNTPRWYERDFLGWVESKRPGEGE